jgi:hypothetical protein
MKGLSGMGGGSICLRVSFAALGWSPRPGPWCEPHRNGEILRIGMEQRGLTERRGPGRSLPGWARWTFPTEHASRKEFFPWEFGCATTVIRGTATPRETCGP